MVIEHVQGHTAGKWQSWETKSEHTYFANFIDRLTGGSLNLILKTIKE